MTQWRLENSVQKLIEDGNVSYMSLLGGGYNTTTQTASHLKFYTAFTFSDLRINLSINAVELVLTLQDDTVATDVAITTSSTGWIENLADSHTIVADSTMEFHGIQASAMHGDDFGIEDVMLTYEHASIDAPIMGSVSQAGVYRASDFSPLGSSCPIGGGSQTHNDWVRNTERAQSLSNLFCNAAAATGTWNVGPTINGTRSTNVVLELTSSGDAEDITGSETYAVNDTVTIDRTETLIGTLVSTFQVDVDTPEVWRTAIPAAAFTTQTYASFGGHEIGTSADDNYDQRIGSTTAGHLVTVVATAGSGTRDTSLRVESTDSTNLTISISATGYLEDLTGSESVADTDSVVISSESTSGAVTLNYVGVELPWSDPSGVATRRIFIT